MWYESSLANKRFFCNQAGQSGKLISRLEKTVDEATVMTSIFNNTCGQSGLHVKVSLCKILNLNLVKLHFCETRKKDTRDKRRAYKCASEIDLVLFSLQTFLTNTGILICCLFFYPQRLTCCCVYLSQQHSACLLQYIHESSLCSSSFLLPHRSIFKIQHIPPVSKTSYPYLFCLQTAPPEPSL